MNHPNTDNYAIKWQDSLVVIYKAVELADIYSSPTMANDVVDYRKNILKKRVVLKYPGMS